MSHIYIIMNFLDVHETDISVLLQEKEPVLHACHISRILKPSFAFLSISLSI